jgi:hypothetical protein
MALRRETPVILSAARLKEVILQSRSMVNTPSAMLSRIAETWVFPSFFPGGAEGRLAFVLSMEDPLSLYL